MSNVLEQKIVLKTQEYSKNLKQVNNELRDTVKGMKNGLLDSSKAFSQNESQAMKWGKSVGENLKNVGKAFKENLATGAKAMALNFGAQSINQATKDAVALGFSFSKAFSEIRARSNASAADLDKWRRQIMTIGKDTGASMDSLAESFKELFNSVGDKNELMKVMGLIGQAAAITGGDASESTALIKDNLVQQGRAVNVANVRDLLGGAQLGAMHGDFKNIDEVMAAMNQIGGANIAKSKLSSRQLAALLSGATRTGGGREAGTKAVEELLGANANGLMQGSILNSLFGGAFGKNGVNVGNIVNEQSYKRLMALGGNETQSKEIFKVYAGAAGMSDQGAEALFNMIKNFKDFNGTFKKTVEETKSLERFYEESTDNLPNAYQRMIAALTKGFSDMFSGFESPLKKLFSGDLTGAAKGTHGALKGLVQGAADNPAVALGGLATTAAGGYALKKVLDMFKGGGLGGVAGKVLGGAGGGAIPVYVVNMGDTAASSPWSPSGAGGAARGAGGLLGRAGAFLGKASQVGLAGYAGYLAGDAIANPLINKYGTSKNQYGQDYTFVEKGIAKLMPEFLGGMSKEEYDRTYNPAEPQKVVVEIQVNDPLGIGFSAVPKAYQNQRSSF